MILANRGSAPALAVKLTTASRWLLALVSTLAFLALGPSPSWARQEPAPGAQQDQKPLPPPGQPLKVSIEVVNVYAVVQEKKGHLVPDLNKDDFEITEDNVPQQVKYFSRQTDTPLTLGMMVDTSPSQERVLPTEQEQAKAFLNQVLRPKDLAFVLHFDLEVELLQDFTADLQRLTHAIDETVINGGGQGPSPSTFPGANIGGTHLYDAVWLAANELLKNEVGRKVLILMTDGEDQGSREKLSSGLEAAQRSDVIIYSVEISDQSFYHTRGMGYGGDSVLRKLSEETGGRVVPVKNAGETAAAFQQIARELRTQYLLGYTSTNTKHDGTYRKIRVEVKSGNYKIQTRRGYYAPSQ
ncbi:MAG TPA: VWA domain-containing protein [Terriglobia bacterium]|nr:VWA domain-containing protein [Terriglobia bacterium]